MLVPERVDQLRLLADLATAKAADYRWAFSPPRTGISERRPLRRHRQGPAYRRRIVQGIYASHVLEHLSCADFWTALDHTLRMLKPGGIFRLVVPDLQARAERYLRDTALNRPEANSWFMQATRLGRERHSRGLGPLLREMFGGSAHLWMWDENSLTAALGKTGFTGIRRCRFGDCADARH
jgi:hypothetical protein